MLNIITSLLPQVLATVDKVIPDADAAQKAKQTIELELIKAANDINLAQVETNKTEAAHRSVWVSGWRPAVGWCCALGVFWMFIGGPAAQWIAVANDYPLDKLPVFPTDLLFELLFALLGMAGLRSFEKMKGIAK